MLNESGLVLVCIQTINVLNLDDYSLKKMRAPKAFLEHQSFILI